MIAARFVPLVVKQVVRHRARTILTLTGVALAMFLFCAVQAMRAGVATATRADADETTLVVYRENRFCPFTSQLPEDHGRQIASLPGVRRVTPTMIVVNNCRTALDVVTFRGVPADDPASVVENITLQEGSLDDWTRRTDAALVGRQLATRRNLRVGDRLSAAGITVSVAGIIASDNAQDENTALVHLGFLQRSASNRQGIVTQFNVQVDHPAQLDIVAAAIDDLFKSSQAPTWTSSERAFVARAVADIVELVNFAGWLGIGSLIAIFALVANAIALSVQDRVRDHAVMHTLGYGEGLIARLVILEGLVLSVLGGLAGAAGAAMVSYYGRFAFFAEGMSVSVRVSGGVMLAGLLACAAIGIAAGMLPAIRAARMSTTEAFRAV